MRPLLIAVMLLTACASNDNDPVDPDPSGELSVSSLTPADGTTDADPLDPLSLVFDQPLNAALATADAFAIRDGDDSLVTGVGYLSGGTTVTLTAPLQPGRTYHATINTALEGESGELLGEDVTWEFSTAGWTSPSLAPVAVSRGLDLQQGTGDVLHMASWATNGAGDSLRYSRCTSGCDLTANWSTVNLLRVNTGGPVSLAPDAGGGVHLLFQDASGANLIYGVCPANCLQAGSWTWSSPLGLAGSEGYQTIALRRSSNGMLHATTVVSTGARLDVIYASCSSDCGTVANWHAIGLDSLGGSWPDLAVAGTGAVFLLTRSGTELALRTCADHCLNPASWQEGEISGADVNARPRLVLTSSGILHALSTTPNGSLSYLRCISNCTSGDSWEEAVLEPPGNYGRQLALTVRRSGRVHALYADRNTDELRYATCATSCGDAQSWTISTVLPGAQTRLLALTQTDDMHMYGVVEGFVGTTLRLVH